MKFSAFLQKTHKNGSKEIKSAYLITKSHYSFPTNYSSKASIVNWCKKQNVTDETVNILLKAWDEFLTMPYATTYGRCSKIKPKRYVD